MLFIDFQNGVIVAPHTTPGSTPAGQPAMPAPSHSAPVHTHPREQPGGAHAAARQVDDLRLRADDLERLRVDGDRRALLAHDAGRGAHQTSGGGEGQRRRPRGPQRLARPCNATATRSNATRHSLHSVTYDQIRNTVESLCERR